MKSLSDTKSFEQWFETSNWPEDSYYTNCARDAWLASAEVKDREYGLLLLEKNRLEAVQHDKVKQRDEVVDAIHKEFYNGKNSACNCMGAKCLNTNCKAFWKFAVDEPRYIKMLIEVSASRILELVAEVEDYKSVAHNWKHQLDATGTCPYDRNKWTPKDKKPPDNHKLFYQHTVEQVPIDKQWHSLLTSVKRDTEDNFGVKNVMILSDDYIGELNEITEKIKELQAVIKEVYELAKARAYGGWGHDFQEIVDKLGGYVK